MADEKMSAQIASLEARIKELEQQISKAGENQAAAVAAAVKETAEKFAKGVERAITLLPVLGDEKVKKEIARFADMDESTFSLMAEVAAKKETPTPQILVGGDKKPDNGAVHEDSLENL